jgi:hypothetical protein
MKNTLIISLVIALILASYFLGRRTPTQVEIITTDTITVVRTDTIRVTEVKEIEKRVIDTILVAVKDTIILNDTTYIQLPREQKTYQGENYKVWVSGYRPKLDSLNIYEKTIIKEVTNTIEKKWGLGVMGGYGATKEGLSPFIGVGIYYKIL